MPVLDTIFFYCFAAMTLGGAVLTITRNSAVHSALSLIVSLLGVAGLYLLQKAEFLFAAQIVLYIGGIMVLFLFVIMLVNLDSAARERQFNTQWPAALGCLLLVAGVGSWFLRRDITDLPWNRPAAAMDGGNTELIADVLFTDYLLPFEIASILLLVAVVGSVFLARKKA